MEFYNQYYTNERTVCAKMAPLHYMCNTHVNHEYHYKLLMIITNMILIICYTNRA